MSHAKEFVDLYASCIVPAMVLSVPEPLVSIVIPTYNSKRFLHSCLRSIKRQSYKNIEVIVVDNFSTDGTAQIAMNYGARLIRLRSERARAKNFGMRNALGEFVMFIDSDMELSPGVVEECVSLAVSDPRIAGIIIPERTVGKGYWARVRDFERRRYIHTPIESPRFFRRDLAMLVGGFDEDIVFFEEATLPLKLEELGYNVRARVRAYIIHHEESFSLSKWLSKKYYYGTTFGKYLKRYGKSRSIAMRYHTNPTYRIFLLLGDKSLLREPNVAVGAILLKSLELIVTLLGWLSHLNS